MHGQKHRQRPEIATRYGFESMCTLEKAAMDSKTLNDFATRYTAAWCRQRAASMALWSRRADSGVIGPIRRRRR